MSNISFVFWAMEFPTKTALESPMSSISMSKICVLLTVDKSEGCQNIGKSDDVFYG